MLVVLGTNGIPRHVAQGTAKFSMLYRISPVICYPSLCDPVLPAMRLPINESIRKVKPFCWQVGSMCIEQGPAISSPNDAIAVAQWVDGGVTYRLYPFQDTTESVQNPPISEEVKLVHEGGTLAAVWQIGQRAFCKVHTWEPHLESEATTIRFVKRTAPEVPVPNVIYEWFDQDRSFLIVERLGHCTVNDAWPSLSSLQREQTISTVGRYCQLLARNTSRTLSSVTGKPCLEPYLASSDSQVVGPLTFAQCQHHFHPSPTGCLLSEQFHFYHPDLGPTNIMMSKDGTVAGIIDWEAAGYYPEFWIATKPAVSSGLDFCPVPDGTPQWEWRKSLMIEMERLGYSQGKEWYMDWMRNR